MIIDDNFMPGSFLMMIIDDNTLTFDGMEHWSCGLIANSSWEYMILDWSCVFFGQHLGTLLFTPWHRWYWMFISLKYCRILRSWSIPMGSNATSMGEATWVCQILGQSQPKPATGRSLKICGSEVIGWFSWQILEGNQVLPTSGVDQSCCAKCWPLRLGKRGSFPV